MEKISAAWLAIDRNRAVYGPPSVANRDETGQMNGCGVDVAMNIVEELHSSENAISEEFSEVVIKNFTHLFTCPDGVRRPIGDLMKENRESWCDLIVVLREHLSNCYWTNSALTSPQKSDSNSQHDENSVKSLEYISSGTILKEIDEFKFEPLDYLQFIARKMTTLCSEQRDSLTLDINNELNNLIAVKTIRESTRQEVQQSYLSAIKTSIRSILKCLSLMQSDIACFEYELSSKISKDPQQRDKMLINSEKIYFSQILGYTRLLRVTNSPKKKDKRSYIENETISPSYNASESKSDDQIPPQVNPEILSENLQDELKCTSKWLKKHNCDFEQAVASLLLFESDELPETWVSAREELTFHCNFYSNFILIGCMLAYIESKYKETELKFDEKIQKRLVNCVIRVMSQAPTNMLLFEVEKVSSMFFMLSQKELAEKESKQTFVNSIHAVCNPKSSLYKLLKSRMSKFLAEFLRQSSKTNAFDIQLFKKMLPSQFRPIERQIESVTRDTLTMIEFNKAIYSKFYEILSINSCDDSKLGAIKDLQVK